MEFKFQSILILKQEDISVSNKYLITHQLEGSFYQNWGTIHQPFPLAILVKTELFYWKAYLSKAEPKWTPFASKK